MSDQLVKIIACNPEVSLSISAAKKIQLFLQDAFPETEVTQQIYAHPQFIDCGSELTSLHCPLCSNELSFDWWSAEMDKAYKTKFNRLICETPCCKSISSLNDLHYRFDCGFSTVEFTLLNPTIEISRRLLEELSLLAGIKLRVIYARV